jgi:N-acetylmuramoyl-L-alanine amidase
VNHLPRSTGFKGQLAAVLMSLLGHFAGPIAFTTPTLAAANAPAESSNPAPAEALAVKVEGEQAATTFEIELSKGVTAEVFTLANPYRVIVDLPDVTFRLPPGTGGRGKGLISAFRYGLFAERKARVVIDTTGPVKITSATMVHGAAAGAVILRVAMAATDAQSFAGGTGATRREDAAKAAGEEAAPVKKSPKAKPVIVIDPGHGGIDPGASGINNVSEKSLVLAVAQRLQAALAKPGVFDVRMTRSSDVFVSLDRRLKFSADQGADLFVSLHADSIAETNLAEGIRGATVYTLSERASDDQARKMAEKENASDLIAGLQGVDQDGKDQVKSILIDLMKRETLNFSADFSNVLVGRLKKSIAMARDPQRSAAFKVLKQTHAPSVLVELGYMTNSKDQQEMSAPAWQDKVAGSIAAAVTTYFAKRTAGHP